MGIFRRDKEIVYVRESAPDPKKFRIVQVYEYGNGRSTVLKVHYPDAKNFGGMKIMVYKLSLNQLLQFDALDPHFSEQEPRPFARFEPTTEGWEAACYIAQHV